MKCSEVKTEGVLKVEGYSETSGLLVGGKSYQESLILTPKSLKIFPYRKVASLNRDLFKTLLNDAESVECLLIGTGKRAILLEDDLFQDWINQQIGVECMTTRSACYTFNLFSLAERNILCILLFDD